MLTHIYATNPAARTITVGVTDTVYNGANAVLHTTVAPPVNVPANTTMLVVTDTVTVPSGTTGLYDIATASYADLATGIAVPGQTSAAASATVQSSGSASNTTATVSDSESITGANLSFSVDSVTGTALGSFTGYTLGTQTTGTVLWNSGSQSGDGTVTFHKTVYVGQPSIETGTLSDTATLTGSSGFTASASASTDISVGATVSMTIDKTIPVVLGTGDTPQTFTFDVTGSALPAVLHPTITFNAGDGGTVAKSATLTGLPPSASAADPYTITEEPAAPYAPTLPQTAAIVLPSCSGSVTFTNSFGPATAEVQKITDPAGSEAGWVFTLTGPNTPVGGEVVTTTGTAPVSFSTALGEGSYTVTEAPQTGWDNTGVTETTLGSGTVNDQTAAHQCTFSVNYPADADHVFSCAFTNTQRGRVRVVKTVGGLPLSGTQSFTFTLQQGTTTATAGTVLETQVANAANGGTINFATLLVPGATYQMCETVAVGWLTSLGPGLFTGFNGTDNSLQCVNFSVTPGQTLTFTVDNTPPPGGQARTIGYWKNWASCSTSKGKQKFILDQTLASFPNQGVTVGVEFVNTCQKAVAILNKSDYLTGKKMASDPAYNLAAQLLAADLNVQAGAAHCTLADQAISAGQALLAAIGFNGSGSYAATMTAAQITQANSLAATLDQYNNNLLC